MPVPHDTSAQMENPQLGHEGPICEASVWKSHLASGTAPIPAPDGSAPNESLHGVLPESGLRTPLREALDRAVAKAAERKIGQGSEGTRETSLSAWTGPCGAAEASEGGADPTLPEPPSRPKANDARAPENAALAHVTLAE